MNEPPDYAAALREFVGSYRGPREAAIRQAADIFDFYARLMMDARLPRHHRALVNAVLAYFVVPEDLFPEEELGPFGLVDNLYVSAAAFRMLARDTSYEVLSEAWRAEGDLDAVMALVHKECRAAVGKKAKDVLRIAGLS